MRPTFIVLAIVLASGASTVDAQQVEPPPVRTTPPFPNRANEALPAWLRVRGEFRERVEGFSHSGFTPGRDDNYFLSRLRIQAVVAPNRLFPASVQLQDARVAQKQIGPTSPPFRGPLDLRMAHVDIGSAQQNLVAVRVGRQELAFGEQRLIGHLNWTNTARSFDGVRATIRRGANQFDVFGASVVRVRDHAFDKSGSGSRLGGVYGSLAGLVCDAVLEPYVFWRTERDLPTEAATTGDLNQATIGARFAGKLPAGLDYGLEVAGQIGSLGSDTIGAWAGHWQLRESFPGRLHLRVIGEFNYASATAMPPTAGAARSISCTRPATTSSGSPIRSGGATSATRAPVSRSRRCAAGPSRPATMRGGSLIGTMRSTTPAARRSRGSSAARRRPTSARRSTSRSPAQSRPNSSSPAVTPTCPRDRSSSRLRPAPITATRTSW